MSTAKNQKTVLQLTTRAHPKCGVGLELLGMVPELVPKVATRVVAGALAAQASEPLNSRELKVNVYIL